MGVFIETFLKRRFEVESCLRGYCSGVLGLFDIAFELPQQGNLFDCGLFLLHYVELFMEKAPVNFSPFQITKSSNFEHYKVLKAKSFFPKLINYITSGPVVCMAWEGVGVVASVRKLIGSTNPLAAEPGTIRGDLVVQTGRNVIHRSDSPENGKRIIGLWFKEGFPVHKLIVGILLKQPWRRMLLDFSKVCIIVIRVEPGDGAGFVTLS